MSVKAVGNPPPEADALRASLEKQLPEIINQFSVVLQERFGFENLRVGGFTVVPAEAAQNISCDEDSCSID